MPRSASRVSPEVQRGLELACRYLNKRERTEAEVRDYLEAQGIDLFMVNVLLAILSVDGYLDDERYARVFAEDKRNLEDWGSDRIRRALLARGVAREHIEAALSEEPTAAELERALALLRRRFPAPLRDRRERERALAVLLRKGYDSELALDALTGHTPDAIP